MGHRSRRNRLSLQHRRQQDRSYGLPQGSGRVRKYLYNIDDSKIDHMVYPKDLVEYARNYQGTNGSQVNRVVAGDPCTKTGYWFTPAQANSRRHFQQGEIMPRISDSKWGDTLWYWSGEN
ncbi:hypothetical protein [Pseudomonas syringae]|uniref:hypothetical protein n=1 Tax=Pseudomonas syringae TaxID=317 RepID=UPI00389AF50A